jgi:hypothetical protein
MSRQELVDAYLEGGVSRRAFVRRLIASGVSVGAAISYAEVLAPDVLAAPRPRAKGTVEDMYPLVSTRIVTRDISDVRHNARLKVKVTSNSALVVHMAAFVEKAGHLQTIGFVPYVPTNARTFTGPGTKTMTIPIFGPPSPLAGMKQAKVFVEARFSTGYSTFSTAKATLK